MKYNSAPPRGNGSLESAANAPQVALADALTDDGEPLALSIRASFEQAFSTLPSGDTPEPGCAAKLGAWQISAPESLAERTAREMGDRTADVRNVDPAVSGGRFAEVRVHRGASAARASEALSARAFTLGNHIFFADRQYDPASTSGRRLIGHELTHVLQTRSAGRAGTSSVIMRESLGEKASNWQKNASKWYDDKKWVIYRGMIAALKTAKTASSGFAHLQIAKFPDWMQGPVGALIDASDFVADLVIALLLIIIGLAVGFAEGIVGLVTGLMALIYGLCKLTVDMIVAMLGNPEAYKNDVDALVNAVKNIPPGLKQIVENWLERYKKATLEEQAIMGGELIGQIEAFIATFALAGTKSGQITGAVGEANTVRAVGGGAAALEMAPALVGAPVIAKTTAEGAVVSQQMMLMSGQGPGGMPPGVVPPSGSGPLQSPIDEARSQVDQDLAAERSKVAAEKKGMSAQDWARRRGGLTKRLYNLLERRSVLARKKAFPGRTFLEQVRILGVKDGGKLTKTAEISKTGQGRIADILELDGPKATLEDLKSPSTQLKSVKGGMSSPDVEAQFRSSSEIDKQHEVERQVINEAKRVGGKVIVEGVDPIGGGKVELELDPDAIGSRVTDYTDIGNN